MRRISTAKLILGIWIYAIGVILGLAFGAVHSEALTAIPNIELSIDGSTNPDDPSMIPDAVEEMFRAYAVVTTGRFATADTDIFGVPIKKGDMITGSTLLSTSDPDEFENPGVVDITRSPNRHNAFSFGPHRCVGSHLARRRPDVALDCGTR